MLVEASPRSRAAELAVEIYSEVLDQVRGDVLVRRAMSLDGDRLVIQDRSFDLANYRRVLLVAVGKPAVSMAEGAVEVLGDRLSGGLIVTKHGHGHPVTGLEVIEAGHPVPDEDSLEAGRRILEFARSGDERDFVVFLLSGGSSALMEAPAGELSLADLRELTEFLLASGKPIGVVNAVRSRVSRIKRGGLARAFWPATVVVLALSDVIGAPESIGSGPFTRGLKGDAPGPSLFESLPRAIRAEILAGELMDQSAPDVPHFVIGSISVAAHAAIDAAEARGITPFGHGVYGENIEKVVQSLKATVRRRIRAGQERPFMIAIGGESTVKLPPNHGLGGRCQELAVAFANTVSRMEGAALLAAGTDGTDGPTDAAGGMVEPDSLVRARGAGFSARDTLERHDSYHFLDACGGLIKTGPTGSNVNDLTLFVLI